MYQTDAVTVTVPCPCCQQDMEVRVYPAEPATRHYPGAPEAYEYLGPCECSEWAESHGSLDDYEDRVAQALRKAAER